MRVVLDSLRLRDTGSGACLWGLQPGAFCCVTVRGVGCRVCFAFTSSWLVGLVAGYSGPFDVCFFSVFLTVGAAFPCWTVPFGFHAAISHLLFLI